jgi:hypothetical protein
LRLSGERVVEYRQPGGAVDTEVLRRADAVSFHRPLARLGDES